MIVIKRNGERENFDVTKIEDAVKGAFSSVGREVPEYLIPMVNSLFTQLEGDAIGVEEIQDKMDDADDAIMDITN